MLVARREGLINQGSKRYLRRLRLCQVPAQLSTAITADQIVTGDLKKGVMYSNVSGLKFQECAIRGNGSSRNAQ